MFRVALSDCFPAGTIGGIVIAVRGFPPQAILSFLVLVPWNNSDSPVLRLAAKVSYGAGCDGSTRPSSVYSFMVPVHHLLDNMFRPKSSWPRAEHTDAGHIGRCARGTRRAWRDWAIRRPDRAFDCLHYACVWTRYEPDSDGGGQVPTELDIPNILIGSRSTRCWRIGGLLHSGPAVGWPPRPSSRSSH